MIAERISLTEESLQDDLSVMVSLSDELRETATEVLKLTIDSNSIDTCNGPCLAQVNNLISDFYDMCIDMALIIEHSKKHLEDIRDDIIASQGV